MRERLARRQFVARSVGGMAAWLAWPLAMATLDRHDYVRAITWRRVDGSGTEVCSLLETTRGPALRGVVIGVLDRKPIIVCYSVQCTPKWETRHADIRAESGGFTRSRILERDSKGNWRVDGERQSDLQGFVDVDLGITPATNTLPIRRLNLAPGETAALTAAWVRFPDLSVSPLAQTYRNLGDRRYRYGSHSSHLHAEVVVDEQGLVRRYGNLWERSSEWPPRG